MSRRVVAIIQARMGSSRLPGKVLREIEGEPMLGRVVTRVARAHLIDEVLVATTTDGVDDPVVRFCASRGIRYFRGSQYDVLDRYYQASVTAQAETVVRITADCPVIDPGLIDDVVASLIPGKVEDAGRSGSGQLVVPHFAANRLPPPWKRTYPIGLDVEACTFDALARAWREASEPQQREHVMPYLYEGVVWHSAGSGPKVGETPRGFSVILLDNDLDLGDYRWTVDTSEDLDFICEVYGRFKGRDDFSWREVLALVTAEPGLMQMNAAVTHKSLSDVDRRAPGR